MEPGSDHKLERRGSRVNSFSDERYSVCIAYVDYYRESTYYKYFRVADYIPQESPDELVPAIVQEHTTTLEEARANPDHLFNPAAARNHESRESDFYLFQWKQDPSNLGKHLTRSFYDDASLLSFKEAKEVILLERQNGEQGLRDALSEGIPFEGRTTSVFYIVYGNENGLCPAIRCQRRDFSFSDGKIRLRHDLANIRETVLSAPRVWLNNYDIIESPHAPTSYRKIYAKLGELEADGRVLLRQLDYFASDYVKWFIREESIQLTKSNRRAVSQIIDAALSRPDALEAYLDAGAQEEEVQSLRNAIAYTVMGKEDPNRGLFRRALLEDEDFYQECVNQVMRSSDVVLEQRKNELAAVKKDIERAQSSLAGLSSDIDALNSRKKALETDIADLSSDLEQTQRESNKALEEIQSNIALKLGLRAVAAQPSVASASGLAIKEGSSCDYVDSELSFEKALLNNLKRHGVTSVVGVPADERAKLVIGLAGALAATRFMAIPQALAYQVADSISVTISGCSAKRVFVPADYRDAASVVEAVSEEDGVVVVDGVIDAVNEGVLFSLFSEDVKPVVILPFVSHASAALIAKEAWGKMFLPCVESLLVFMRPSKVSRLQRAISAPEFPEVSVDDALEEARDLSDELDQLNLATEPLLLAGTVLRAVEKLADEETIVQYIAQHLLICSRCDGVSFEAVGKWSEEDSGLLELAKRLGIYES